ncbi:DUF3618 domain-containing protein [Streptomyces gobiensis]|uniref:DUF3618 domain-containing protein n=1 Tax=Streptomyces gobiensis TaxID=2875706 RepID=UPI001E4A24C2|nr:DUF3618 domain-containing protein [Streptomyces gobiensis]UGY94435.1 DUF3618 domain-containing protein [Streptomyces gobiensis]
MRHHAGTDGRPGVSERELRDAVEQTREQLGETVEELAAKFDLKAKAQERAAHVKERAERTARSGPGPLIAMGAGALVAVMLLRRLLSGRRC